MCLGIICGKRITLSKIVKGSNVEQGKGTAAAALTP